MHFVLCFVNWNSLKRTNRKVFLPSKKKKKRETKTNENENNYSNKKHMLMLLIINLYTLLWETV